MKIAILIVRILLGALMVFASLNYFFKFMDEPMPEGEMLTIMTGFMATKYLFPLVKIVELVAGITLLSGKFMKLGLLILLPITVNIFLLHAFVAPADLPVAIFVLGANLFLIYAHWDSYKDLFKA
jgi:putative oxidoreductase